MKTINEQLRDLEDEAEKIYLEIEKLQKRQIVIADIAFELNLTKMKKGEK